MPERWQQVLMGHVKMVAAGAAEPDHSTEAMDQTAALPVHQVQMMLSGCSMPCASAIAPHVTMVVWSTIAAAVHPQLRSMLLLTGS